MLEQIFERKNSALSCTNMVFVCAAATERSKPDNTGGAARTNYHSNCMLSERAKKRMKMARKELGDVTLLPGEGQLIG